MKPTRLFLTTAWIATAVLVTLGAHQRDPKQYQQTLENPDRLRALQVERAVATLGIKPGTRIADLGAGTGVFTIPLAMAAGPTGKVYAIDIDPGLLAIVSDKARAVSLMTIETVVGSLTPAAARCAATFNSPATSYTL